jgi:putative membrane protein insertion efficiency factor
MATFLASLASTPQRVLLMLVRGYRLLLSPWLQAGCPYEPTCSNYALQALQQHGAVVGSYLGVYRIVRCHPFCEGGHDPVPELAPRLFQTLFPRQFPSNPHHKQQPSP